MKGNQRVELTVLYSASLFCIFAATSEAEVMRLTQPVHPSCAFPFT